ncbi:LPXTG cell wall anchor domain-containing protein [Frigoribacterium salinisoli]
MTTRHTWRRALAVPAALSLALGGALFGATAASAAPGDLQVTSPAQGQVFDTLDIDVVGTAPEGTVVSVFDEPFGLVAQETVDATGTFSTPLSFAPESAPDQTLVITSTLAGATVVDETITRDFVIPGVPVDPTVEFDVTEPAPGTPLESRTVTFSGTGTDDSTVTATDADDAVLADPAIVTDGVWTLEVVFAEDAPVGQTVTFTQLTDGVESGVVEVTLELPAATPAPAPEPEPTPQPEPIPAPEPVTAPATPVITAPVQDETVVGDRVTFQGTGTPGSDIGLFAVPTADLAELEAQVEEALAALEPQLGTFAQPSPQPEPVDPTDRIVVGDDGTWSVTLEQVPGEYTVVAFAALFEDGTIVTDPTTGLPVVSGLSTPVEYSLVTAVVPAATTPVAVVPADSALAYTGSETSGVALGLAGALTLAGVVLTLVARRRRALEAVAAE